jgi:ketosteroid isomerase-like protein
MKATLNPPAALIEALYAAFNRRDIDAVLAKLHPDVVWPNGWEGGVVSGHAAVRDYWTRQWAAIDPSVTPQRITVAPDGAVSVDVHQVVRDLGGRLLSDGLVTHVYAFDDGLVTAMSILHPQA